VSFFSLEFGGPEGVSRSDKWREVCRDPVDANPKSEMRFCKLVESLQPGTSYAFRIRGFNGFGPGDYTYKTLTTAPAAPACPRIIRIASDAVTLRWVFSEQFFKRLAELKRVFQSADSDQSGWISRSELIEAVTNGAADFPALGLFLRKAAAGMGLDVSQGYEALFDMIEGDDDDRLSWQEFESFFMTAGWASGAAGGSVRGSYTVAAAAAATGSAAGSVARPGDLTYIIERCENEFDEVYKEVMRSSGSAGEATVSRLESGKSYRFRVYSVNCDGVVGPRSPSVVVHTLLETPPIPLAIPRAIGTSRVVLSWRARGRHLNTRSKEVVQKMLGDWAGSHGEDDGGVSLEMAFAAYDKNQNGEIDASELALLLEDLGVEVTEERLRDAFALFDDNKDGVISFEEFARWWRRDDVSYVIKRSEAVAPLSQSGSLAVGDSMDVGATASTAGDAGRNRRASGQTSTGTSVAGSNAGNGASRPRPKSAQRGRISHLSAIPEDAEASGAVSARSASAARARPASARLSASATAANGITATASTAAALGAAKRQRQVAMPIVCYRGPETKCEVAGLEPNRL
jgi:Ca2+-binding EF-hand superfamily protein